MDLMPEVIHVGYGDEANPEVGKVIQKAGTDADMQAVNEMSHDKVRAALALWTAGATYGDIAKQLQMKNPRVAMMSVERALSEQVDDGVDRSKLRRRMSLTLDRFLKAITPKAIDPEHPEQLAAVRTGISIIDRYSKLNGLDAPIEVQVNMPGTEEFQRFVELAAIGQGLDVPNEADPFDEEYAEVIDEDDDEQRTDG